MRRTCCGGCGSSALTAFLDLGTSPLADRFPKGADDPEERYPLGLSVCRACWLVQLTYIVPDAVLWGGEYGFYTGASPSSVSYFRDYADEALKRITGRISSRLVVEIGANDGTLLAHFAEAGWRCLGIDPAENVADAARERGLQMETVVFTAEVAKAIRKAHGPAGLIIANNVLAHAADPGDMLEGIAHLLTPGDLAMIEVQNLPDLIAGNQFDHVYHEHRYYFSVGSLAAMCQEHGLHLASAKLTPAQGGSIRATVVMGGVPPAHMVRPEPWLRDLSVYDGMAGRVGHVRERLLGLLDDEIAAGRTVAGYGASAKSTTLLNYCGIGPDRLAYVEDKTPHKIGRVTPGMHIPITDHDGRAYPDTFLLLAWNYLSGVLAREREFTQQGGRFIVPIPLPVVL